MKRICALLLLFVFLLSSCQKERDVLALTEQFVSSYGAEGIIYSTERCEGEEGYIDDELEKKFFGDAPVPEKYALFLNSHVDYFSECGAFVAADSERIEVIELCNRRISLLDSNKDNSFIRIYGKIVFYSTMSDMEKAEKLADLVFK